MAKDNNDIKITEEDRKAYNELKKQLKEVENVITSDTFLCSAYFIKYTTDKKEEYFNKFITMYNKLDLVEKSKVIANVIAYFEANKDKYDSKNNNSDNLENKSTSPRK